MGAAALHHAQAVRLARAVPGVVLQGHRGALAAAGLAEPAVAAASARDPEALHAPAHQEGRGERAGSKEGVPRGLRDDQAPAAALQRTKYQQS